MFVVNDVRSAVEASIDNATVITASPDHDATVNPTAIVEKGQLVRTTANTVYEYLGENGELTFANENFTNAERWRPVDGSVKVRALETAFIQANADINVEASGGSFYGTGTVFAVNGQAATNVVLSRADAFIRDSEITTNTGDLNVEGTNTSTIDATVNSSTSTSDTGVGITLAFNSIGWQSQNLLFNALDTIIGRPLDDYDYEWNETVPQLNLGDRVKGENTDTVYWFLGSQTADAQYTVHSRPTQLKTGDLVRLYADVNDEEGNLVAAAGLYKYLGLDRANQAGIDLNAENYGGTAVWAKQVEPPVDLGQENLQDITRWLPVTSPFGGEQPARTSAYILNSDIDVAGDVNVTATSEAQVNATVSNATSSSAGTVMNNTGKTVGAVLASNKVSSKADAYIDVRKYDYTSDQGTKPILLGTRVLHNGSVYEYVGSNLVDDVLGLLGLGGDVADLLEPASLISASLELGAQQYATDATNWKPVTFPAETGNIDAGGNVTVAALDNAGVYANVKMVSSSIVTNDGGMSIAQETLNDFIPADFNTKEGTVQIQFGDYVRLADDFATPAYTTDDGRHDVGVGTKIGVAEGYDETTFTTDYGKRLVLTGDTVQIADDYTGGGEAGRIYKYIGGGGSGTRLDLGAINYGTDANWVKIGGEAGVVYEKIGSALAGVDLGTIDYSDANQWKKIGGSGAIYEYLGTTQTLNLNSQDYTNLDLWKEVLITSILPEGYNVTSSDSTAVGGLVVLNDTRSLVDAHVANATVDAASLTVTADETAVIRATTDSSVTASGGSAWGTGTVIAVNGTVATNQVLSSADAYVVDSTITTATDGDLTVHGTNTSVIDAETLSSTTSGDTGVGVTLAFNTVGWKPQGVLFNALDTLIGRPLESYDYDLAETDPYASTYPVATNGLAQGDRVKLANGDIYWYRGEAIDASVTLTETMLADRGDWVKVTSPFAGQQPAAVNVYVKTTELHIGGDLSVTAIGEAAINATVSNETTAAAVALMNASSLAVGVVVAKNMVSSKANAYIDGIDALTLEADNHVAGSVTVAAEDAAMIDANSTLKAAASAVNDFGISVAMGLLETLLTDYQFTSKSGVQEIGDGALVRVASDYNGGSLEGKVFQYIGAPPPQNIGDPPVLQRVDLGTTDYSDTGLWFEVKTAALFDFLDTLGLNSLNLTGSAANAFGGLIIRNDVRGGAEASIENSNLRAGGGIAVTALETATIRATDLSTVLSQGGTKLGNSIAVNGLIAHNLVLGNAYAHITDSDVLNRSGDIVIDAQNTSTIEAEIKSDTRSKGVSVGVTLAFNTVGYQAQNIFFDAIDALFGTNLADALPVGAHAAIENSDVVVSAGALRLSANSDAAITASIDNSSTSIALAVDSDATTVAVGAVLALNKIATSTQATIDGVTQVKANGTISVQAIDTAAIISDVSAVSLGVSASPSNATAVSVGVSVGRNEIRKEVLAYLTDTPSVLTGGGDVIVKAQDEATIEATSVAAAVSAAVSGQTGCAFAGGGSESTNIILTTTNAYVSNSNLGSSTEDIGKVDIDASSTADIDATIAAVAASVSFGGTTGIGVALGVSVARNFIGWDIDQNATGTYSTNTGIAQGSALSKDQTVRIAEGARGGDVYKYLGEPQTQPTETGSSSQTKSLTKDADVIRVADKDSGKGGTIGALYRYIGDTASNVDLSKEDYSDAEKWQLASVDLRTQDYSDRRLWQQANVTSSPSGVKAFIENTSIHAAGDLTADAVANQSIDAVVVAGAAAISGGGTTGVGVSGAGVYTENRIKTLVKSFIDGDGASGVTASSLSLQALDNSTIKADAGAASLAAGVGGNAGVAVSIGISLARNEISNQVSAYIANADNGVKTTVGGVTIKASETATIDAFSLAASLVAGIGGSAGVAVSGAGAWASNTILTDTNAYILNSEVESATFVDIDATNSASIDAIILAASLAVAGGGSAGVGVSIGLSIAENQIGEKNDAAQVMAYIQNSTVNAKGGALTLDAVGSQSINAIVVAGSAAVAGGGAAGVGVSGAGVIATNLIIEHVKASIDDDDNNADYEVRRIHADSISINAADTSNIMAAAGAASLAASFSGTAGVSVSIGVSVGHNEIRNEVEAYIRNAATVEARTGAIVINAGTKEDPDQFPSDYSSTSGTVALKKGDTVKVDDGVYRFLGEGEKVRTIYESSAGEVYLKNGDTIKVIEGKNGGGTVGAIYTYTGPDLDAPADDNEGDDPIDLTQANYSTGPWTQVAEHSVYDSNAGEIDIKTNDIVEVIRGYTVLHTSDETGADLTKDKTFVRISQDYDSEKGIAGGTYKFIGLADEVGKNLANENYEDKTRWVLCSSEKDDFGEGGTFYKYKGDNANDLDLSTEDYKDTTKWEQVSRSLAAEDFSNETYWAKCASITALSAAASLGAGIAGAVGVAVSGAGAEATNVILTKTNAFIENSNIWAAGNVDMDAANTASIDAVIVSASAALGVGGTVGVGASLGVSLARNYIGWDTDSSAFPDSSLAFSTGDSSKSSFSMANSLSTGDVVRIDSGARAGDVYQYTGSEVLPKFASTDGEKTISKGDLVEISSNFLYDTNDDGDTPNAKIGGLYKYVGSGGSLDLREQDYTDGDKWEYVGSTRLAEQDYGDKDSWQQVNLMEKPSEVQAYVKGSSIYAGGSLTQDASASGSIKAFIFAGSAAISGGGVVGVGVSGAGVGATNRIATKVGSYIDGDGASGISADSVALKAQDTSTIEAYAGAASLAASFAGVAAVSVSIGAAAAFNIITNDISAYIADADNGVTARRGEVRVEALENAGIQSVTVAASLSVGIGLVGIALSGAGAYADNVIANSVRSYIDGSTVVTATPWNYLSNQQVNVLMYGHRVRLVEGATGAFGGGTAGQIYQYIGATQGTENPSDSPVGLSNQNYLDNTQWRLVTVVSKDIIVDAQNHSSITSVVGALSAGVSGGLVAVAGSVGLSLSNNVIGEYTQWVFDLSTFTLKSSTYQNEAFSYIRNSTVLSAGDLSVTADSTETIQSDAFAGSVALAIGLGGAVSGAGVEVTNDFDTHIRAYIDQSDAVALGDILVKATSDSHLIHSSAIGASISVGMVSLSVAASLVGANISNDVQAYISGDSNDMVAAGGDIRVEAEVMHAKVEDVVAVTASISAGLQAVSGGGVVIGSAIDNSVAASISGALDVAAIGDITVRASENAYIEGDAANVTVAFGLGMAIGVSVVSNAISSDISASLAGDSDTARASVAGGNLSVLAQSTANIPTTNTAGVAASLIGLTGNAAQADISTTVAADVSNADVVVTEAVMISATANNTANTFAAGGAFGAIAAGAMVADVSIGAGATVNEVTAGVGDHTSITAGSLSITATGTDILRSSTVAASGGLVSVAGAISTITSDSASLATVGEDVAVTVGTLVVNSVHSQNFDSRADAVSFGLAAGTGAGAGNTMTTGANVNIGVGSGKATAITADSIYIKAVNVFSKDEYADGYNLDAGSAGLGTLTVLASDTQLDSDAIINIGSGTSLTALGSNETPGSIEIEAVNSGTAKDSVRVESVSGFGIGAGLSRIEFDGNAEINVTSASIENKSGDVYLATSTNTELRPSANLMVASYLSGVAAADVTAKNNVNDTVTVTDSTIKASDIYLMTGRSTDGTKNILFSKGNAEILAVSLYPNIAVPIVDADINETNQVNVLGNSKLQALEDVNLIATTGSQKERAKTSGMALSLSFIPYGMSVPDRADDVSNNQVNVAGTALVEAGLNNMAVVRLLPVKVADAVQDDLLSGNGLNILDRLNCAEADVDVAGVGHRLSDAELAKLSPALPAGLKYEYAWLDVNEIVFSITNSTIIQVVTGANAGGTVGDYYEYKVDTTDGSDSILLENENYGDAARWTHLGATLTVAQQLRPVYQSNVTTAFRSSIEGKFYVIKPVEMAAPTVSYVNIGNMLLEQRDELVSWILNHTGDADALARYQVQLDALDETLEELGLTQYYTEVHTGNTVVDVFDVSDVSGLHRYQYCGANDWLILTEEDYSVTTRWSLVGTSPVSGEIRSDTTAGELVVKRELDTLFVNIPSIYASPGSVFIERDRLSTSTEAAAKTAYQALVDAGRLIARAGAQISIQNQTPFTSVINDAIIKDNKKVEIIDGVYTVFEPGNVWLNTFKFTDNADAEEPQINITQDAYPISYYDFPAGSDDLVATLSTLDQDMYIVGDVINENGALVIDNKEGSIIVSGTLRAKTITVTAERDFSLNTEGWFHTNQDPRQYISYDAQRAAAITMSGFTALADLFMELFGIDITATLPLDFGTASDVPGLSEAINRDDSRILAQGKITITARFLNINGLIQSGVDTITLYIDDTFNPGNQTVNFTDDDGNTLAGISFGADGVPVDGFFDAARQAIVLEEIVPQGGEIVLAGQILSTGNGLLRVANGYTSVDIDNETSYDLVLDRIDTTTDRKGKITIIDTGASPITKDVYETSASGVVLKHYTGVEATQPVNEDGVVAAITYTLQSTGAAIAIVDGIETQYEPREGLHYLWVEGQSKTKTTTTVYEKNSFNLFGDNKLADLLSKDHSWTSQDIVYTDKQPLLESETLEMEGTSGLPSYANGDAYTIRYKLVDEINIDAVKNLTKVFVGGDESYGTGGQWYLYIADDANIYLPGQEYTDTAVWQLMTDTSGIVVNSDTDVGVLDRTLDQYPDSFTNSSIDSDTTTTGGGWLRKKTVTLTIVEIEGLKDMYTHTLKADYLIAIDFIQGPSAPSINVTTWGNLILQGDMESPESGTITLTSLYGSITGADGVAIYGATPVVHAGQGSEDIIRLNIEGNKTAALIATAGGDITVNAISLNNDSSSFTIDQVNSTHGNVLVNAPDGINAKSAETKIAGELVELDAFRGAIGTSALPMNVDSDIDGVATTGGLAARAKSNLYIIETAGDLRLVNAVSWTASAAVISTEGDVYLKTSSGSLFDGIVELFRPGEGGTTLIYNNLSAELKAAYDRGEFSLDAANYALSPGLMRVLFPHTSFLGLTPDTEALETPNVIGKNVTLIAGGTSQIGHVSDMMSMDMSGGFAGLSNDEKVALSMATADDIVGVSYDLYKYVGSGETDADLKLVNFTDSSWQKIAVDFSTGSDVSASVIKTVGYGQTVLVQLNSDEYGLYRYLGGTRSMDLVQQDYGNAVWQRLTTDRGQQAKYATDDAAPVDLDFGDLVLNKFVVQNVTLQLWDDVDLEADGTFTAEAGGGVAVQTTGAFQLDHVLAGGNVRLQAEGSITDLNNTDETAAIGTFGDLTLLSETGSITGPEESALEIQLLPTSRLSAQAAGDIIIDQIAGDLTINGETEATSDLRITRVVAGGIVKIQVLDGDMYVGKISSDEYVDLQAPKGSLLDIFDDVDLPSKNVVTPITGDVYLRAGSGGNIGTNSNFLEILILDGELTSLSDGDTFIHSFGDLYVENMTSTGGNITLQVDGSAYIDKFNATSGAVTLNVEDAIVEGTYTDSDSDIDAVNAILNAGDGIASAADPLETEIDYLEADAGTGGIWLDNTGDLIIGGVSSQVGIKAGTTVDISAASSITVSEAIDSAAGPVLLDATDDIHVNAPITSGGGIVTLLADNDITFNSDGSIDTESGSPTVTLTADYD